MMNQPAQTEHGAVFDLDALGEELRGQASYRRDGQAARTLILTQDLRVVLIALAAGKRISEHQASATVSVQVFAGYIRLRLRDRDVPVPLHQLLVLGSGLAHDVHADTDSVFLLTLGKPDVKAD
jgi:quercetin dioxygenase-like cupin family protein